jgi:hypothetical protein
MIFLKKFFIFLIILFLFLFFPSKIFAELRLNEIYPAPPLAEDEWVELYNDEDRVIDVSKYQILDLAGNKIKISTTSALPFSFILATSSSVLNNGGDTVYLYKCPESILIDTITYPYNNNIKNGLSSFGRFPDGKENWAVCSPTKGTNNSSCVVIPTPTPNPTITPYFFICPTFTPTPTPLQSPTPTLSPTFSLSPTQNPSPTEIPIPTPISYQNIYLSEIYPNPQTGENEWVEIYNDNDFIVNLNNWYIDDIEDGGSSPKKFSLTIQPKNYASFDLSTAIFNNDGDSVRLLDFDKKEKDSFEYKGSQKGKSFGRISLETDDFCLQEPSKNQKNNLCLNPTPTQNSTPTATLTTSYLFSITTSPTKTALPLIKKSNQNPYYYQTVSNIKIDKQNNSMLINKKADILGIYNKRKTNRYSFLSLLSFSYSVLSAFGIIIKTFKHFS